MLEHLFIWFQWRDFNVREVRNLAKYLLLECDHLKGLNSHQISSDFVFLLWYNFVNKPFKVILSLFATVNYVTVWSKISCLYIDLRGSNVIPIKAQKLFIFGGVKYILFNYMGIIRG